MRSCLEAAKQARRTDAFVSDLFGDAYECLISNYATTAGKSGGEFFMPQHVSKLIDHGSLPVCTAPMHK